MKRHIHTVAAVGVLFLEIVVATILMIVLCNGDAAGHERPRHPLRPHVIKQEQHGTERWIYVHNNLPRPIWAYFECDRHLTVAPIGIRGDYVSEIRLADIEPDERCLLNHFRVQVEDRSPPEWTPYDMELSR